MLARRRCARRAMLPRYAARRHDIIFRHDAPLAMPRFSPHADADAFHYADAFTPLFTLMIMRYYYYILPACRFRLMLMPRLDAAGCDAAISPLIAACLRFICAATLFMMLAALLFFFLPICFAD